MTYILLLTFLVYLHSNFSGRFRHTLLFLQEWRFGHSKSFKVIDFGANWKRVCDFLLVPHSNHRPILHRFRDIAGFLCSWLQPIPPQFWGCSRCTRSPMLGQCEQVPWAIRRIRPWNYFRSIPTCVKIIPQRTDGRTRDILSHNRALRSTAR